MNSVIALLAGMALQDPGPWPAGKANAWLKEVGWLAGANFAPSTAINPLEMWQADTFDPETIDRELGWAAGLGFNSMRVFLHPLLWEQDAEGFCRRIERYLEISHKHGIGTMFVLFDGCWDPFPKPGPQRAPRPHVHNSGWVQSPGVEILKDPARHDALKPYVAGVVKRFREDPRVQVWDLFNEPENPNRASYGAHEPQNKAELALLLLRKAYAWAREARPAQPITSGVWSGNWGDPERLSPINRFMLEQSDVVSFHTYGGLDRLRKCIQDLRRHGRPILCTEYMSRGNKSTFDPHLGYMKEQNVAAYNWGLVAGKTQTIYPWDSWKKTYTDEPPLWFHDIFRRDGAPYDPREAAYIRGVTGAVGR